MRKQPGSFRLVFKLYDIDAQRVPLRPFSNHRPINASIDACLRNLMLLSGKLSNNSEKITNTETYKTISNKENNIHKSLLSHRYLM